MKFKCFNLDELASIYKSLILLENMPCDEAMELIYYLNCANIDTMRYRHGSCLHPSSPQRFYREVNRRGWLFRTSVMLARAVEGLLDNISITPLIAEQRLAVHKALAIVDAIYNRMEDSEGILVDALLRAVYRKA